MHPTPCKSPIVNDTPPECEIHLPAWGDFSQLASPILVAAANEEQFSDFLWKHALICSEVHRFMGYQERHNNYATDKILLLLPGWSDCPRTAQAVEHWSLVQDRYTCALHGPPSRRNRRRRRHLPLLTKLAGLTIILTAIYLLSK